MTLGLRLQELLNSRGTTDESLANNLSVSIQQVIEWKNDREMPSAEILIKLATFFNMSVDELLNCPAPPEKPFAKLKTTYNKKLLTDAFKNEKCTLLSLLLSIGIGFLIFIPIMYIFITSITTFFPQTEYTMMPVTMSSVCGIFEISCLFIIYLILRLVIRSKVKKTLGNQTSTNVEFLIYSNHITVEFEGSNNIQSFGYVEFTKITELENYYIFYHKNGLIMVADKNRADGYSYELSRIAIAYNRLKQRSSFSANPERRIEPKKLWRQKVFGIFLMIFSIFSLYYAMPVFTYCISNMEMHRGMYIEPLQRFLPTIILFAFMMVPVASIIYGIVKKKQKFKTTKNIVAGCIVMVYFLMFLAASLVTGINM